MKRVIEQEFVQKIFRQYYLENVSKIKPPSSISKREFGAILFHEKMMIRHRAFKTAEELQSFITSVSPSDIYYSSAYYEYPENAMDKKKWLGADLIFDIDSDHIQTPCKKSHDYWICENCGNIAAIGEKPARCVKCGGAKFKTEGWICDICLDAAKNETQKLLDFLIFDFGFKEETITVCFSGQRGYHVHIEDPNIQNLDQNSRKEIADYITGTGLKLEFHGLIQRNDVKKRTILLPELNSPGWGGRIMRGIYDVLGEVSVDTMSELGFSKKTAKLIQKKREEILDSISEGKKTVSRDLKIEYLIKLAEDGIRRQASAIDTVVTTDIHRLIRLPETLHGKTGLKAIEIPLNSLEKFDPLKDSLAFRTGAVKV
ncbi:MAG: DNA primase small subunit PriS, partial [Candidatus Bathyarchaeia archaeon]